MAKKVHLILSPLFPPSLPLPLLPSSSAFSSNSSFFNFFRLSLTSDDIDYDEEAHALFRRLNLDPSAHVQGKWNPLDPIWRHPEGGGIIYVGNQSAAENLRMLKTYGITHVVNCTVGSSQIPNFHEESGAIQYYRFSISRWKLEIDDSHESILEFTRGLFEFIETAISNGNNVMVHCLAGAHRAGTTGCACLIHFADMDVRTAVTSAKKCRPIIDPIGALPQFLERLYTAKQQSRSR